MKTLHKVRNKQQFPEFWNEEWLKAAIQEVDTSTMSAQKRLAYEMLIVQNAAAVYNEKKKVEEARQEIKIETVTKSLQKGLTHDLIAEISNVSLAFVLDIQRKLTK